MVSKQDVNALRAYYESHWGHVDDISHVFGWASHEKFYGAMQGWHAFVDSIFPDYFPFNMVQGFLQTVIDNVYSSQAQLHYDKGVDMGRQLVGKAEEIVNWAKNQITNEVNAAKKHIQDNFITPIQNAINNNIKPQLSDAQSRIDSMLSQLSGFDTRIQGLVGDLNGLDTRIVDLNNLTDQFDKAIQDLKSKASALDTKITNLNSLADQFDKAIEDLKKRVSALEGITPTTGFQLPSILEKPILEGE